MTIFLTVGSGGFEDVMYFGNYYQNCFSCNPHMKRETKPYVQNDFMQTNVQPHAQNDFSQTNVQQHVQNGYIDTPIETEEFDVPIFTNEDWIDFFGYAKRGFKSSIELFLDDWKVEEKLEEENLLKNSSSTKKRDGPNISKLNSCTVLGYHGAGILNVLCKIFKIEKKEIKSCDRVFIVERKIADYVKNVDLSLIYKSRSIKFRDAFVIPTAVGLVKLGVSDVYVMSSGRSQFKEDKNLLMKHIKNYLEIRKNQ
jgi:hypothetical protein